MSLPVDVICWFIGGLWVFFPLDYMPEACPYRWVQFGGFRWVGLFCAFSLLTTITKNLSLERIGGFCEKIVTFFGFWGGVLVSFEAVV